MTKEKIMLSVPDQYRKPYLEGERASFEEEPHSCRYEVGSEEAQWWSRGYETSEDLNDETPPRGAKEKMVDFTQLTPEQIVSYVAKHSHLFASSFDEGFPDNIARTIAGPLWATIRRREGFAIVFKGTNPLFGGDGKNADLMFLHVLPEYEKQGIGTAIVEEAKAAVPQGRTIDVTCEGAGRMRLFARCGFIVNRHQADADIYQMRWTPSAPSTGD